MLLTDHQRYFVYFIFKRPFCASKALLIMRIPYMYRGPGPVLGSVARLSLERAISMQYLSVIAISLISVSLGLGWLYALVHAA